MRDLEGRDGQREAENGVFFFGGVGQGRLAR